MDADDDCWLEPADTEQIQSAISCSNRRSRKRDGLIAPSISLLVHVLVAAALAEAAIHFGRTKQWSVARGDPSGEEGASNARSVQPDSDANATESAIASAAMTAVGLKSNVPPVAVMSDERTALADVRPAPLPSPPDPVIGISSADSGQAVPNFAATQPLATSAAHPMARAAANSQIAAGVTTPPSVAHAGASGRKAGERGERDGFDSRGLPIPDYPAESRRRGEEGVVMVDVEVLPDGNLGDIRVVSDAGYPRLAHAATAALKTASFQPARIDGRPVVGHLLIPYLFTLD